MQNLNINPEPPQLAGVDPILREHLNRNLLKYAAGYNVTCPACGSIMDCKRTVILSVSGVPEGKQAEEPVREFVQCAKCWDKRKDTSLAALLNLATAQPHLKLRWEITDGRTVFAKAKRQPQTKKAKQNAN